LSLYQTGTRPALDAVRKAPYPAAGEATQAQFEARTRHDWAIVALKSNVRGKHVWPLLRFSEKRQTLTDCQAQMQGKAIVKIGYPIRGLFGETRRDYCNFSKIKFNPVLSELKSTAH